MKNFRLCTALLIVVAMNLSLSSVWATPHTGDKSRVATGIMSIAGTVTVDGTRATSGQTIFTGSHVVIAEDSQSMIDLGSATRLVLASETELTLDFSRTNVSSVLGQGKLRGFVPAGLPLNIKTADVEVATDSSQPAAVKVEVVDGSTRVTVEKGRVDLRVGQRLKSVSEGQVFSTAAALPGQTEPPDDNDDRKKVGIFVAIGAAAAILAAVLIGRGDDPEDEFGDCVIILSGPSVPCM